MYIVYTGIPPVYYHVVFAIFDFERTDSATDRHPH